MNLFILLIALTFILVPSFALISSSPSNDTSSDGSLSNETFSSLSHSLGENQSGEQSTPSKWRIWPKGYLAIPEKYDKLITSLRTAYANELTLDKEQTSYDDSLDALRLSLKGYNIKWRAGN